MRLTALAAAGLLCLGLSPANADWSIADMNRQIDQTNFVVNTGCSGTLFDLANRYILTASHCVAEQYETIEREVVADDGSIQMEKIRQLKPGSVRQKTFDGPIEISEVTYRTKLIGVDKVRDLAVVQVLADIPNTLASKLSCTDPQRGDAVYIVGNPMGDLYSSVVPGSVASVQRSYRLLTGFPAEDPDEALLQIAGGVVGGNSGGAVYNTHGEIVGVPVAAHRMNEVLGFAVPLSEIRAFLSEKKIALSECQ